MAVISLFDKSFLQSLSVDESVFFDQFFLSVICPIFFVETLADLEKAVRQGRTPEEEVGIMAAKTPELNGAVCANHLDMFVHNLMGYGIPMDGRIPRAGGKHVKLEGKTGLVYEPSPEEEAFLRWQEGDFLQVERRFAKVWRKALGSIDLLTVASGMTAMGINPQTCTSIEDAKRIADSFVQSTERPLDCLKLSLIILGSPPQAEPFIAAQWEKAGYPPLTEYAPFAAHVITVELFFQIALAANLISTQDANNRTDMSYLFYLPFCMVFVSTDTLHRRVAPLFMRPDQQFVWGQDLKADLRRMVEHYNTLPDTEKEKGVIAFAPHPPKDGDYLTSQLWDRHLGPWREPYLSVEQKRDLMEDEALLKEMKKMAELPAVPEQEIDPDPDCIEMMSVQRRIRPTRGSFRIVSKSVEQKERKQPL